MTRPSSPAELARVRALLSLLRPGPAQEEELAALAPGALLASLAALSGKRLRRLALDAADEALAGTEDAAPRQQYLATLRIKRVPGPEVWLRALDTARRYVEGDARLGEALRAERGARLALGWAIQQGLRYSISVVWSCRNALWCALRRGDRPGWLAANHALLFARSVAASRAALSGPQAFDQRVYNDTERAVLRRQLRRVLSALAERPDPGGGP